MTEFLVVQSQVSQLDEPVYARIHEKKPDVLSVIYWNNYGFRRQYIDPEIGQVPDFTGVSAEYPKIWVDSARFGLLKIFKAVKAIDPKFVLISDIPNKIRIPLCILLRLSGFSVGVRSDKNHLSGNAKTSYARFLESVIIKNMYNFLCPISFLTSDYYRWPASRVSLHFPYATDERKFAAPELYRKERRAHIRRKLGLEDEDFVFLSASKFVARENPDLIFDSFSAVADAHPNTRLIALGDGPLFHGIQSKMAQGTASKVRLPGFIPFKELEDYFFASDVFLHFANVEPWGVSVQDALLSRMPVIASNHIGSATALFARPIRRFLIENDVSSAVSAMLETKNNYNSVIDEFYDTYENVRIFSADHVSCSILEFMGQV